MNLLKKETSSAKTIVGFLTMMLAATVSGQFTTPVSVSARLEPYQLRAGEVTTVIIEAVSEPEFHIYAVNEVA
ncbi:MAG: hypothetical protein QF613_06990, partial [Candidatus Marinimicrobia bacterium]|nr:hypothetical protein [Candidatus Neomarinimicrobiota bacterium]